MRQRQPIDAVASVLFELLLCEINGEPKAERQVIFAPELVIRQSTQAQR
ncbi:MAG TPA: hypothetical protein VHO69_15650 [Phototrophicaceae bacterium]|nr:hypothetical protein [Phototrophicaceae bacterium]